MSSSSRPASCDASWPAAANHQREFGHHLLGASVVGAYAASKTGLEKLSEVARAARRLVPEGGAECALRAALDGGMCHIGEAANTRDEKDLERPRSPKPPGIQPYRQVVVATRPGRIRSICRTFPVNRRSSGSSENRGAPARFRPLPFEGRTESRCKAATSLQGSGATAPLLSCWSLRCGKPPLQGPARPASRVEGRGFEPVVCFTRTRSRPSSIHQTYGMSNFVRCL